MPECTAGIKCRAATTPGRYFQVANQAQAGAALLLSVVDYPQHRSKVAVLSDSHR